MCRYGFKNYKLTYGCFSCQIGFKRRHLSDVQPKLHEELSQKDRMVDGMIADKDFRCPNCGGEMANLGRDLKLPNKYKDEQWQASELPDSHLTVESGLQISTGIASDRTEILPG
jgi:hypothetical protein